MFKNYFKTAWRNLRKEKGFSAINIIGLAVGLSTCLLITLFVLDELKYDKQNEKSDRIFRIVSDLRVNGNGFNAVYTPNPMGPALVKDFPGIDKFVRLSYSGTTLVKKDKETLLEPNSVFADSTLFEVFTIPMIAGNPHTALKEPHSMVISESMAKKYFNGIDAMGKSLLLGNTTWYKISGIIRDMPAQSHFHFNFIKAMSELDESRSNVWLNNNPATYLLARPGITSAMIDGYLETSVKKYIGPEMQTLFHASLDDMVRKGDQFRYTTMPVTDIHLYSNVLGEFEPNSNIRYVYIFIIIAVFILLIACVNFMNLSTARSAGRSKEVGVRKVLGSLRSNLISQFLVESVLTSFISMALGMLIAMLLLPYFNELSGKNISSTLLFSKWMIPVLLLTSLIVGFLAGIYPAFYLSAFRPIEILKGKLSAGFKSGWLRNTLVVFQFTTAIVLIIGTLIIYSQLNYIRNKELGYSRDQVLTIDNTYSLWTHARGFKEDIQKLPGVVSATMTRCLPNRVNDEQDAFFKDATLRATDAVVLSRWLIDADYIPTLQMKIVKGRNFSPQMPTDTSAILINETAATLMGFPDPLNKVLYAQKDNKPFRLEIIGVVKDFNGGSLHNKIQPTLFNLAEERGAISLRINTTNLSGLIAQIKDKYSSVDKMAGQPFIYSFMDDDFNKLYAADQRTGKIFVSFAVFAIFIACLGLFGLVTYAAEQRTKEIGVRKVLGATVGNLVGLLSKDFLKLVMLSALVAFPLAWWSMHRWLEDFAYRTPIGWWVFAVAGISALAITLVTVSFRAIRSALANPIKSLRTE
jgi:putative ABC transport system permease protein